MNLRSPCRDAALVAGALIASACFEDAPVAKSGATEAEVTDTGDASTSTASTSGSSTASTSSTGTSSSPGTAATSDATVGTASTATTDSGTESGQTDESSTGRVDEPCGGETSSCLAMYDFCADFEAFDWQNLQPPWTEVPGSTGIWDGSRAPFCGGGALSIALESGESRSVLGAVVGDPISLTTPHRFGARLRIEPNCIPDDTEVRALALQYLSGGTQNLTAELWFSANSISLRHGSSQTGQSVPVPTGVWLDVEVNIIPGASMDFRVNDESNSSLEVPPLAPYMNSQRAQLLLGPASGAGGPLMTPCTQVFDDAFFDILP